MYFMFESFHRRPLETRVLAYTRISVAIILTILFFVYCGYLVNQIKYDNALLRLSTEKIQDEYELPHIEVCAQNTTVTFVRCDLMYMNWTTIPTQDCYKYIRFGDSSSTSTTHCYLFESNGTIHYGVKDPNIYPPDAIQIRRLDIYWKIDSIQNISSASVGIPAIPIMLYDTRFSRWNTFPSNMIPQQAIFENEMAQGNYRSTSMQNYTTTIFFTPSKYKAIHPGDISSLMGFEPPYVDIFTITASQLDWPIHIVDNANILNGVYHGLFSVQLAKTTYEVQTEQRQHTLLSAVALVGGAYGVMVTLYTLLFGMVRHSPWGVVHQIPLNLIRGYDKMQQYYSREDDSHGADAKVPAWKALLFRRVFSTRKTSSAGTTPLASGLSSIREVNEDGHPPNTPAMVTMAHNDNPKLDNVGDKHDSSVLTIDRINHLQNLCARLIEEQHQNHRQTAQLENHLAEFQEVLREYYINMDYLDGVRDMRRRQPTRSWTGIGGPRMSSTTVGGWLLDGLDGHNHQDRRF